MTKCSIVPLYVRDACDVVYERIFPGLFLVTNDEQAAKQACPLPTNAIMLHVAIARLPGALLSVPRGSGLFVRTHVCVASVACPQCKASVRELCRGVHRHILSTHYGRRDAWREAAFQRNEPG